jgi:hypothetical protein
MTRQNRAEALVTWMVLAVFALLLNGCTDFGYRMNELHGLNCRPEALKDGKCVSTSAKEVKR